MEVLNGIKVEREALFENSDEEEEEEPTQHEQAEEEEGPELRLPGQVAETFERKQSA